MVKKVKVFAAALLLALGMAGLMMEPAFAAGAAGGARDAVCDGITAGGGNCNDNGAGLTNVIKLVVQILSVVAGVAAVVMIIVGGLKYITSGGDSSKISSAKGNIVAAIIGLVIVALAQVIVRFVLGRTT